MRRNLPFARQIHRINGVILLAEFKKEIFSVTATAYLR